MEEIERNVSHNERERGIRGCGCGAVGRAVDSEARDIQFESRHRPFYLLPITVTGVNCIERTKIKKKRNRMDNFFKQRGK